MFLLCIHLIQSSFFIILVTNDVKKFIDLDSFLMIFLDIVPFHDDSRQGSN